MGQLECARKRTGKGHAKEQEEKPSEGRNTIAAYDALCVSSLFMFSWFGSNNPEFMGGAVEILV